MRIPATSDLWIEKYDGAVITVKESGMVNGIAQIDSDNLYLTQRPSIDVFDSASAAGLEARGRGIFYWESDATLWILVDGTLYKNSLSNSLSTSPSAGYKPCTFLTVAGILILLDAENDEGWSITTGDVVAALDDSGNFPPKQNPVVPLAYGGASMDQYLFVLGTNGTIYNSALADPDTWPPLGFKNAEESPDNGVYLGKHHKNIVAFGTSSIEFFYNAGNATGSPLNRRQDLSYGIGCSSGESVYEDSDRMFWIGNDDRGALGVWTMENFAIGKISTPTIDSFITQSIVKEGFSAFGAGLSSMGRMFYILTLYRVSTDIVPVTTLVWDDTAKLWGEWDTSINGNTEFALIGGTNRLGTSERYFEGQLASGDAISINDNLIPQDSLLGSQWVVDDWVETGWVLKTEDSGVGYMVKSRLGMKDFDTNKYKYPDEMRHVADTTDASQTLTIRWSDENNSNFSTGRDVDMSIYQKLFQLGRFRRRNHELEATSTEQIRIDGLEIEMGGGDY